MSAFPTPFDRLTDINALLSAVRKLEKSSGWKSSVQRITCEPLRFCTDLRRRLLDGTYRPGKGFKFIVNERGCRRFIRALDPADMVLQHALCDAVEYEIALLKGWRKSDNKRYRELKSAL